MRRRLLALFLTAALLAGALSLLTSVAGLPEAQEK